MGIKWNLFSFAVIVGSTIVSADTIILQNGVDDYEGTKDITLYEDNKCESYSWMGDSNQNLGTPVDEKLIFTDFCC